MTTYSISLRVQRITVEDAYVSVPVSDAILTEQEDGTARIDGAKFMEQAIQLATAPDVQWHRESQEIQPHPMQQPPDA